MIVPHCNSGLAVTFVTLVTLILFWLIDWLIVRIPSGILKIVFRHILFYFLKCSLPEFGFDERRLSYRLRYTCYIYVCRHFLIFLDFCLLLWTRTVPTPQGDATHYILWVIWHWWTPGSGSVQKSGFKSHVTFGWGSKKCKACGYVHLVLVEVCALKVAQIRFVEIHQFSPKKT